MISIPIQNTRHWVVKIGSSLITQNGLGIASEYINHWAKQIAELRTQGKNIVLVSSGAVAAGVARLGLSKRPDTLYELQAAAAIGQISLIQAWQTAFSVYGLTTAQVLLTHDDLANRGRYLNARSTLKTLLNMGVIPIVNENDTVATDEIRFGDNDTLAAMVAHLTGAEILAILTDQVGLFDANPRQSEKAKLIPYADANDPVLQTVASEGGIWGRGGMITKVEAAKRAARAGAHTAIVSGSIDNVLIHLAKGDNPGTLLMASREPLAARKQWLASQLHTAGAVVLDAGAVQAITELNKSLLPVGVVRVSGDFQRGDLVKCLDLQGQEVAKGLTNYNAEEAHKIQGKTSDKFACLLGYSAEPELIHRDHMVIL